MNSAIFGLSALMFVTSVANAAETVTFISCPIYRDTDAGRKSGCWLADEATSGRRFDISRATSKPDWNHEILVEGTLAATADNPCGGVVLEPVRTSILPGLCTRHMLPAEDFKGNVFALPRRTVAPTNVPRAKPAPPYRDKVFHLFFDFDKDFIVYQYGDYLLDQAITYIRAAPIKQIRVTGWAASDPVVVSGRTIAENPQIARQRADLIVEALLRMGIDKNLISEHWAENAQPVDDPEADGLPGQSRRRVDIDVSVSQ